MGVGHGLGSGGGEEGNGGVSGCRATWVRGWRRVEGGGDVEWEEEEDEEEEEETRGG